MGLVFFYPELAKNALTQFFVLKENTSLHQWGLKRCKILV